MKFIAIFFLFYLLPFLTSWDIQRISAISFSSSLSFTLSDTFPIYADTNSFSPVKPQNFSYDNVRNYIFRNLHYPPQAIDSNIQGIVKVKFTITSSGKIDSIQLTQKIHPLLNAEALRLLQEMPRWKPILYHGKPITLTYEIPVIFEIIEDEKNNALLNQTHTY